MKKLFLSIKRSFICILLSFCLLTNNTAATTYQAAAIPVVYTAWEVFGIIFTLLGISLACLDTIEAKQQAVEELEDKFVGWKVLKGEGQGDNDGDGQDDLYAAFDIMDYLDGDKLVIPDEDLQDFKDFYQDNMAPPVAAHPIDNTDIKKMNYQEFCDWADVYFSDYNSSGGNWDSFTASIYDKLAAFDYSGIVIAQSNGTLYFDALTNYSKSTPTSSRYWGWQEAYNGSFSYFKRYSEPSGSGSNILQDKYVRFNPNASWSNSVSNFWQSGANTGMYISDSEEIIAFIVNGRLFDGSIFTKPINATTSLDKGAIYGYYDFVKSVNNLSDNFTDEVGTIGGVDLSDKIQDGTFDIIGDGRDYDSDKKDTNGTITVPMPSGDVITDYQNGLITYEEFLDELGVVPIDKATGTNLFTQEFLDTQTGILSGVDKLVNFVGGIWDFLVNGLQGILNGIAEAIQAILAFLNNLVSSFVQALIDMLLSLFIPADGYFNDFFTRLNNFFQDKLGLLYVPIGLLITLLNALMESEPGSTQIYFPGIQLQEYVLAEPQYVELDLSAEFPKLYVYMHFITNVILIGAVICLLQAKLKELVKN